MQRYTRTGLIIVSSFLVAGLLACKQAPSHDVATGGTAAGGGSRAETTSTTLPDPSSGQTAGGKVWPAAVPTSATSAPSAGSTLADLSAIGLPIYPTVFESAWTGGELSTDKEAARIGQMSSHDSFDKVYDWYRQHMPAGTEPKEVAASNHTNDDGDRMAVFQIGEASDTKMSRVMLLHGKNDDYTIINLAAHFNK
jgi:hypothetical protein